MNGCVHDLILLSFCVFGLIYAFNCIAVGKDCVIVLNFEKV